MARPDNVVQADIDAAAHAANQTGAPDSAAAARTTTDTPVTRPVQPPTGTETGVEVEENTERTPLLNEENRAAEDRRENDRREEGRRRGATGAPTPEPSPAAKKEQEGPGKIRKIVNTLNPLPTVKNGAKEIKDAMTGGARAPNAGYGGLFLAIGEVLAGVVKIMIGAPLKLVALIGFAPFGLAAMGLGKIIDKIKNRNEGNEGVEVRRADDRNNPREATVTPTHEATQGVTPGNGNNAAPTTEMQQTGRDTPTRIAQRTGEPGPRAGIDTTQGVNPAARTPAQTAPATHPVQQPTGTDDLNMGTATAAATTPRPVPPGGNGVN